MEQYRMCELCFDGEIIEGSRAAIDLTAELSCEGISLSVPGFYAGDGIYKVRFLPELPGRWKFRIFGCIQAEGSVEVTPAGAGEGSVEVAPAGAGEGSVGSAPRHGMVRALDMHFRYQDGALFHPFGTTVYALIHQEDALVEQTMESLKASPFNKVRFCVFLKHYDFNHNEPPFYAFEKRADGSWDVNRPCPAFWDRLDEIILQMNDMGI